MVVRGKSGPGVKTYSADAVQSALGLVVQFISRSVLEKHKVLDGAHVDICIYFMGK